MARAGLLILALLLLSPRAFADCTTSVCDKGAAYAEVSSRVAALGPQFCLQGANSTTTYTGPNIIDNASNRIIYGYARCSNGSEPLVYRVSYSGTCSNRLDYNGAYPYQLFGRPRSGSVTCLNGCVEVWTPNADGSFNGSTALDATCFGPYDDAKCQAENGPDYYFNKHLTTCEPNLPEDCPAGQVKNPSGLCGISDCPAGMSIQADGTCKKDQNECPPGNVRAPSGQCLPGEGQCASGEAKGKDGTCKRDSDGDGVPDSEAGPDDPSKDSASGGDSCNSPPSCNGNPIMCAQLRTQWRIDCNTRKNRNVSGGHCGPNGVPICTGDKCDAVEYAQLLQTWKTACAVEKLAGQGGGDGGQPEWTKVAGMNQDPGAGVQPGDSPAVHEREFSTSDLDTGGFGGGGGTCIGFVAGSASGTVASSYAQIFASPPAEWCIFIARLRASLIIMASAIACFIIARGM